VYGRNGSTLAFQNKLKRRRVAAHAVGRKTEKSLHVSNRAVRWHIDNKHAAAITARASNRYLDCMRCEKVACSAGGEGSLQHQTIVLSTGTRERGKRELDKAGRVVRTSTWIKGALYADEARCHLSLKWLFV
jgi:hypothetical protein